MTLSLSPVAVQANKLSNRVYDALCRAIIQRELMPGQRLREAELAQTLGVSRTPLREALVRLEQQQLLHKQTSGAYFVVSWDKQILWEVATLRGALEALASRHACQHMTPEDFDHLETVVVKMESAIQRCDYDRLIALDIEFHGTIWSRAGHILLEKALDGMKAQVLYFMYLTRPGDEIDYPASHRELIQVLRGGDSDQASATFQRHIVESAERAIARLKEN